MAKMIGHKNCADLPSEFQRMPLGLRFKLGQWRRAVLRSLGLRRIVTKKTVIIWWGVGSGGGQGATLGDLQATDNVSRELVRLGIEHDVLSAPGLGLAGHLATSDLADVSSELDRIVLVCGPLLYRPDVAALISRNPNAVAVAVGVSVLPDQQRMTNLFDAVLARDGVSESAYDLALAGFSMDHRIATAPQTRSASAVVCLRGRQDEYGPVLFERSEALVKAAASRFGLTTTNVDTELKGRETSEILSDLSAGRVVFTTRMHAALYALVARIPVIAIDQVTGGAKVTSVLKRAGWPFVFRADCTSQSEINGALEQILNSDLEKTIESARSKIIGLSRLAVAQAGRVIAETTSAGSRRV
jgi:hypothetical protein